MRIVLEYVVFSHEISFESREFSQIGMEKSFEDGTVIFLKANAIKLTEKNYKNVC